MKPSSSSAKTAIGKRSQVEDFRQTNRGGVGVRSIITSERNGLVVGAISVTDKDSVVMMSIGGQTVRISMKDVRVMGRSTQGVRLVNVRQEDKVVAVQKVGYVENGNGNGNNGNNGNGNEPKQEG